jgi:hypothetical protein
MRVNLLLILVLYVVGLGLIAYHNWIIALGVFITLTAHNVEESAKANERSKTH